MNAKEIRQASKKQRAMWAAGAVIDDYVRNGKVTIPELNKAARKYQIHPAAVEAQLRLWTS